MRIESLILGAFAIAATLLLSGCGSPNQFVFGDVKGNVNQDSRIKAQTYAQIRAEVEAELRAKSRVTTKHQETHYSAADRAGLDQLIEQTTPTPRKNKKR